MPAFLSSISCFLSEFTIIFFRNSEKTTVSRTQISTYIPVFVSCGGEELDALDDILSKKVIRKLETQNPIYLRNEAEGLVEYINELFGNDKMLLCKEYIHRLERNA